ncbi:MAG: type IV pilus biogenesis/stability protein PilW [Burkholderiaceae bacterium]|nr:type IV pilus biogenesis/stability protein PilW [Burkholderiaceae bacterium]
MLSIHGLFIRYLLCGVVPVVMTGCSNHTGVSAGATGSSIATVSDASSAHQRAQIRLQLAEGYYQRDETVVALDQVKQALAINPNFADAYTLRGLIYMRLGDPVLAEESFRRALVLSPGDSDAMHDLGWLLCQQARYADAQIQFKRVLAAPGYPERAKTLMTQGICQMRSGDKNRALTSLGQAFELNPSNPIINYNLALLLMQRGEQSSAQPYIRRVNDSPSANPQTLWLGIKIARSLQDDNTQSQWSQQLKQRFPRSREAILYDQRRFDD